MMGLTHRLAGATAWLAAAPYLGQSQPWQLATGALISSVFAHGTLSPDIDQSKFWHWPHRGITHFWPWPLAAFVVAWVENYQHPFPVLPVYAVVVAWGSHLGGDLIFGKTGIPFLPRLIRRRRFHSNRSPRWHYVGLRLFHSGGRVERYVGIPALIAAMWVLA